MLLTHMHRLTGLFGCLNDHVCSQSQRLDECHVTRIFNETLYGAVFDMVVLLLTV